MFEYRAKYDVLCKEDVLELVNLMFDGLVIDEIVDVYVKVKDDVIVFVEEDDVVIMLTNTETKKKVLFRK